MSNIFVTTAICYETRGESSEASSTGYMVKREALAVRWDKVTAIQEVANPSITFDNDKVTEPLCILITESNNYIICCAHAEALRLWQQWEARPKPYQLAAN